VQLHVILVVAAVVSALLGGTQIAHNSLSFDGGLNAQMARTFAEHGRYATYYGGYREFDLVVTTGPTVILPTSLAFKLCGVTTLTAQFTNLMYFIALFILASQFTYRHAGLAGAVLSLVLLVATPGLLDKGLRLYGEVPALVFLLAGLLALDRISTDARATWAAAAGGCFGLALLTKFSMLIPLAALAPALLFDRVTSRKVGLRALASLAAGFAVPLALFEWAKLVVLTPPTYYRWWLAFTGRAIGQGLPSSMPDTAGGLPKLLRHLSILAEHTNTPVWPLVIVLVVPPVALLVVRRMAYRGSRSTMPCSIWILAGGACVQILWWLALTPTSRAWLRRIFVGLVLQEILIAVVLVWTVQRTVRAQQRPAGPLWRRLPQVIGAVLAAALAAGTTVYASRNLPESWPTTDQKAERRHEESMARFMASLPDRAEFFAKGWWRAPVLGALSGRRIEDFDLFPLSQIDSPLDETYLVVDRFFASARPEWARRILKRTDHSLARQAGGNSLFRLERVLPYAPIPRASSPDQLVSLFSSEADDYVFTGGLFPRNPRGRRPADVVSGYRLRRDHHPCFITNVWVAKKAGYRPRIVIKLDGEVILSRTVPAGHTWRYALHPPESDAPQPSGSLVELWVYRDTPIRPFSLWHSRAGSLIIQEVGFDDCPHGHQMPGAGATETGWPRHSPTRSALQ